MKKNAFMFLVLLMIFTLVISVGCSNTGEEGDDSSSNNAAGEQTASGEKLKIGLVTSPLGDNTIADALYAAMQNASEKYDFELDMTEGADSASQELAMIDYTESEEYDLIVLLAYHAADGANSMKDTYPNQKYLIFDYALEGNENIATLSFAKDQMGFMAGVFAALVEPFGEVAINGETITWGPNGVFGSVLGVDLPTTTNTITGFQAGVKYINPDAEILFGQVGDWADQVKAKELASSMYKEGANIIFHNAGGACMGVLQAAQEQGKFFIGYDGDQTTLDRKFVLGSTVRLSDVVIDNFFAEFTEGVWNGGSDTIQSYQNGALDFIIQENMNLPEEVMETMDEIKAQLENGEIDPPSTWDELETFDQVYGG